MSNIRIIRALAISLSISMIFISNVYAWDGYNYDTGSYIDIESYNHQGLGEGPVEYYDYNTGEYRSGYLDMYQGGSGELTDDETGETHQVDMD